MKQRGHRPAYPDRKTVFVYSLVAGAVLVAVFLAAAYLSHTLEKKTKSNETIRGDLSQRISPQDTLVYQGKTYERNELLTTILFIGIDKQGEQSKAGAQFRNGGQADFLRLLVLDNENKTIRWLPIDRDSMTEIAVLGVLGDSAGTKTAQICLAHGFGSDEGENCRYTVQAVEGLLKGVSVDYYISLNLNAVEVLNDSVGGVTVTLEDDFAFLDPAMTKGATLTLTGQQAEYFVHERMAVGDGRNQSRMHRQEVFLENLSGKVTERIQRDAKFIDKLYGLLGDNLVTDMKRGRMINEGNRAYQYQKLDKIEIPGQHVIGESGFVEFQTDEAIIEQLVIDIFYRPVITKAAPGSPT